MAKAKSFFSRGRKVQTVNRIVTEQREAGLIMHRAGSGDGAEWTVDGRRLKKMFSGPMPRQRWAQAWLRPSST